ncbi:MAG: hypothetical protein HN410_20925, partial [Prolixibacteraceae bacterium]|nr:hypothetical protein [Prolixibacteraceae bacterium]
CEGVNITETGVSFTEISIQKIAQTKKAFSVVASLIRIHLISMLDMVELLRSTSRAYKVQVGEPPGQLQLKLI